MIIVKSSRIVFCDVDDTLLISPSSELETLEHIDFRLEHDGVTQLRTFGIHTRHIELLKDFNVRGHTVVVWSQGGWEWAERVVKALGIESFVDIILDKPSWYIDDLPASAFMGPRVYLHPTDRTKDNK